MYKPRTFLLFSKRNKDPVDNSKGKSGHNDFQENVKTTQPQPQPYTVNDLEM